jgi:hypothetical protein
MPESLLWLWLLLRLPHRQLLAELLLLYAHELKLLVPLPTQGRSGAKM